MRQARRGLIEAVLAHQYVDQQMLALGFQIGCQLTVDAAEGLLAAIVVATRVPDLGKIEPGAVADRDRHLLGQQAREALAGLVVHAEREIHATGQERGVLLIVRHALPMLVGFEARQRFEFIARVEMKQDVAVVQVLHHELGQAVGSGFMRSPNHGTRQRAAEQQQDQRFEPPHWRPTPSP